ncbi:MAG TPA: hypothetical protein VF463_19955 [Sphingobium sp.]
MIAQTQIAMATTATEVAAADARLLVATQALATAQAEAAITGQAMASTQAELAAASTAARAATTTSLTAIGVAALGLAAILAIVAVALGALTSQANDDSGLKKYTAAMGYTKAEVIKLNAVTVTWGDTAKAVFQVGMERIAASLGISTDGIKKMWASFLNTLITATRATVAGIFASFETLRKAATLKGAGEMLVKGEGNPFAGMKKQWQESYGDAQGFMDDVVKKAQSNARTRQDAMAKAMYDKPAASGSKSDAEKLADIIRNAQAEITVQQNRLQAVGMSARAAAELEQRTKLLNDVQKAGIPITAGIRTEIDKLSKAYADAKIAADAAEAIKGVTDGLAKQGVAINDQINLIGLYGDALMPAISRNISSRPKSRVTKPILGGRCRSTSTRRSVARCRMVSSILCDTDMSPRRAVARHGNMPS